MDGHQRTARSRTESGVQADSPPPDRLTCTPVEVVAHPMRVYALQRFERLADVARVGDHAGSRHHDEARIPHEYGTGERDGLCAYCGVYLAGARSDRSRRRSMIIR